jgi:hypothetical protein
MLICRTLTERVIKTQGKLIFDFQSYLSMAIAQMVGGKIFMVQFNEESAWYDVIQNLYTTL